ncbi:hypothetical protein [Pseudomonas putida]|uniref:Uncharacterized protein n=1 Tax=Pseudomonas putida TaxID=303 RepID=A0A7V8EJC3_PSEPU|nr:hypothetical protein [Pseudomonas putida]KAF0255714.1 hypothetical protein GN299_06380 [Pseudomonas putida]
MKNFRLWLIKRRLSSAYQSYIQALDASPAGRHMTEQLPSVISLKNRCNSLLAKLAKLDPASVPCTSIG